MGYPRLTNSRMKDMMAVLVQCVLYFHLTSCLPDWPTSRLKDVSDPKQIAPDGQTIEGRMQKLCEVVAEDIKKCANACDTYLKWVHPIFNSLFPDSQGVRKKLLVKIFAGPVWEGKLLEFVGIFTKRREAFEFTLTIHTTIGVDEANLKLDVVNMQTAELTRK